MGAVRLCAAARGRGRGIQQKWPEINVEVAAPVAFRGSVDLNSVFELHSTQSALPSRANAGAGLLQPECGIDGSGVHGPSGVRL